LGQVLAGDWFFRVDVFVGELEYFLKFRDTENVFSRDGRLVRNHIDELDKMAVRQYLLAVGVEDGDSLVQHIEVVVQLFVFKGQVVLGFFKVVVNGYNLFPDYAQFIILKFGVEADVFVASGFNGKNLSVWCEVAQAPGDQVQDEPHQGKQENDEHTMKMCSVFRNLRTSML
jgi:hypothetical protein